MSQGMRMHEHVSVLEKNLYSDQTKIKGDKS